MRGEANLILPEISSILFIICNVSYQSNSGFNCDPGCSFWIYKTNKGRDKSLAFFLSFLRMAFIQWNSMDFIQLNIAWEYIIYVISSLCDVMMTSRPKSELNENQPQQIRGLSLGRA